MDSIAETSSFEFDRELHGLLEEIELQIEAKGQPTKESLSRFQEFRASRRSNAPNMGNSVPGGNSIPWMLRRGR